MVFVDTAGDRWRGNTGRRVSEHGPRNASQWCRNPAGRFQLAQAISQTAPIGIAACGSLTPTPANLGRPVVCPRNDWRPKGWRYRKSLRAGSDRKALRHRQSARRQISSHICLPNPASVVSLAGKGDPTGRITQDRVDLVEHRKDIAAIGAVELHGAVAQNFRLQLRGRNRRGESWRLGRRRQRLVRET